MRTHAERPNGVEAVENDAGQNITHFVAVEGGGVGVEFYANPTGLQAAESSSCAVLIDVTEVDDANGAALGVAAHVT